MSKYTKDERATIAAELRDFFWAHRGRTFTDDEYAEVKALSDVVRADSVRSWPLAVADLIEDGD